MSRKTRNFSAGKIYWKSFFSSFAFRVEGEKFSRHQHRNEEKWKKKKHQLKAHYQSHLMGTTLESAFFLSFLFSPRAAMSLKWRHLIFTPRQEWKQKTDNARKAKAERWEIVFNVCSAESEARAPLSYPFFYDAVYKFSTRCGINNGEKKKVKRR